MSTPNRSNRRVGVWTPARPGRESYRDRHERMLRDIDSVLAAIDAAMDGASS